MRRTIREIQDSKLSHALTKSDEALLQYLTAEKVDFRIQLAVMELRKHRFSSGVQIKEIAAGLHISSSHLRHLFKKELGIAPAHYLKALRLQAAKELLETTFLSVKEVMAAVGLTDLSHFVRDYKKHHGETPSQSRSSGQSANLLGGRKLRIRLSGRGNR